MKFASFFSLSVLLVVASCSNDGEKKIISVEKKVVLKEPVQVAVNREMAVEIEGMSCEHACGGSIRMALKETGAVDRCSFDFKDGRKSNTAFITFDKDKISADKIISIIEELNEKQFTTANATTKTIEATENKSTSNVSTSTTKTSNVTSPKIEVSTSSFEFPNLFDLVANLLN